ncbi:MAG: superoxide dismutase family protein [Polyangiaceae bacterium]
MYRQSYPLAPGAALLAFAFAGACGGTGGKGGSAPPGSESKEAVATLDGKSGSQMTGQAVATAAGDKVTLKIEVTGATPGEHAVHIHEKGDCSAGDASSAGPHWNPTNEAHGKWGNPPYHLGDIGNMQVGDDGRGSISLTTDRWTLGTGTSDDLVGHSVVVHAGADDFTSQPSGSSGDRVGCGVLRLR